MKDEDTISSYTTLGENPSMSTLITEKSALMKEYAGLPTTSQKHDHITKMIAKVDAINTERKKDPVLLLTNTKVENTLEVEKLTLSDIQRSLSIEQ